MLDLKFSSDFPAIGLETKNAPQGYMYAKTVVFVERPMMADILRRIGIIDESTIDVKKTIDSYMEFAELVAAVYVPDSDYHEAFTSLTVKYPSHVNDYDGSIEWNYTSVFLDGSEQGFIRDSITRIMGCDNRIEMAKIISDKVHEELDKSNHHLRSDGMTVYRARADEKDGTSHLHCDFYLPKNEMIEFLVKTNYLRDHTNYYESAIKTLAIYEEAIDNNIRFNLGANLYEDGTGELVIQQYDIKSRYKWERDNKTVAREKDLPLFYKETITVPLSAKEVDNVKIGINHFHERIHMTITADKILENIVKANARVREKAAEGPINEDIKTDKPYIVREGGKGFIEVPLSFSDGEFNELLKRQPLTYEDGTVIHSTEELKPDTWIWAFAQIDKSNKAVIEMQIDGISQTQGKSEILTLTDKETNYLIHAVDKRCKEEGSSYDYLKSHIDHKGNNRKNDR